MKTIQRAFLLVLWVCLRTTSTLFAQQPAAADNAPSVRFGVFGAYNLNQHLVNFLALPGIIKRENDTFPFGNASGSSVAAGVLVEIPLATKLRLALRAEYATHNITLKAIEKTSFGAPDGTFYFEEDGAVSEYSIVTSLGSIGFEPLLMFNPFGGLQIQAGLRGGYMLQKSFVQSEAIPSSVPNKFTFENGSRERNVHSGTLPQASALQFAAVGGVGYEIPLGLGANNAGGTLFVTPEAFYMLGLNPVVSGLENGGVWNLNQLRAGVALKYSFPKPVEPRERRDQRDIIDTVRVQRPLAINKPESVFIGIPVFTRDTTLAANTRTIRERMYRTDTLIVRKPPVTGSVTAVGVTEKGAEMPVAEIRVEEFLGQRYLPLLNYVFFEENSAEIPERYAQLSSGEANKFTISQLFNFDPLAAYRQILNIIGRRMKTFPKATVTLTGCNSNNGIEKAALPLSLNRAEAVRDYLVKAWKLDPNRIIIRARNLSENPSIPVSEADKIEENRRVEITSDLPEITEWIVTPDTLRFASPPIARFKLNAQAESGVQKWRLLVEQNNQLVRGFSGAGDPPKNIDWEFMKEASEAARNAIRTEKPFIYTPYITDNNGQTFEGEAGQLPVRQITIQKKRREMRKDKEYEHFSLILFDFNRAELSPIHRRTAEFVKERVKPNSDVEIIGYTDRTGSADYNRKLAEQRAQQIAAVIARGNMTVRGVGKDDLLYDNEFPEGRYYCRTVTITIETPIQ